MDAMGRNPVTKKSYKIGLRKGFNTKMSIGKKDENSSRVHMVLAALTLSLLLACHSVTPRTNRDIPLNSIIPKMATVDEVIQWVEKNLYFKNVDPWDSAPEVIDVIKDGYGDCKMLAGVVSVLLDSVGKKNLIIVIKKRNWHMFNTYEEDGKWHVVDNGRLVKRTFRTFDEIKSYFKVSHFEETFDSYKEFQRWFNEEIYPKGKR